MLRLEKIWHLQRILFGLRFDKANFEGVLVQEPSPTFEFACQNGDCGMETRPNNTQKIRQKQKISSKLLQAFLPPLILGGLVSIIILWSGRR
jgi:hypothetical protein